MASKKTKFTVGIFVIVGMAIGLAAVVYFGLSGILEKGRFYAAYFDESVQGLDKDSAVKYRGVTVGRVESINVAEDNTLIEVLLKIETDMELGQNIVAQLKPVGITGIMFVELDVIKPDEQDASPKINFKPDHPMVATKPSEFKKYMASVDSILDQLNALDVQGISDRAKSTLDNVNTTLDNLQVSKLSGDMQNTIANLNKILNPDEWQAILEAFQSSGKSMDGLIENINGTVATLHQTISRVDGVVKGNEDDLNAAIENFNQSLADAGTLISRSLDVVDHADQTVVNFHRYLMDTMQNLETATRNLNRSLEQVADRPSALIFSKPPEEKR